MKIRKVHLRKEQNTDFFSFSANNWFFRRRDHHDDMIASLRVRIRNLENSNDL